jgi:tRNA(Ile2) C34 agmatinyltransferase TiaS
MVKQATVETPSVCTDCGDRLVKKGDRIVCSGCGKSYPDPTGTSRISRAAAVALQARWGKGLTP